MSTQGLTNAEIQQALALRTDAQGHKLLSSSLQYNAMETAGLLSAKKTLTMAEIEETAQTILGSDADIEAAISAMNLSIVTDEQGVAKAILTKENLQAAIASGALTKAQAEEIAAATGVSLANKKNVNILGTLKKSIEAIVIGVRDAIKAFAEWAATPTGLGIIAFTAAATALIAFTNSITTTIQELEDEYDNLTEKISKNNS